ncbi:hypothetical protein DFP72DRAFT_1177705 [Ephemerocybe angulata]|uniref:Uncharacterized protein n=1 Tax=Ephemerocybe angulata TaxID=980116 RepID=A0A8H6HB23_9AGAR|nr:hypothetical protein DFP72DRAFT_1177705 [Tulosesus angulatus]
MADIRAMLPSNHTTADYDAAISWHEDQILEYIDNPKRRRLRRARPIILRGVHSGGHRSLEEEHILAIFKGHNGRKIKERYKNPEDTRWKHSPYHHIYTSGALQGATAPHVEHTDSGSHKYIVS